MSTAEPAPGRAYCTILARNYLPKALALADSLHRHEAARLTVLLIDEVEGTPDDLPLPPNVELVGTDVLGIPERELLRLAMAYDLVELATAVKPLLLAGLLEDAEQVVYLDPDTYLTAPMEELGPELTRTEGGILLTPHFLHPPTPDAGISEGHLLTVGFYNLGFCAVDRRARGFLDWWWGHLRTECLFDPLSGLFVDQKWMDIGAPLFSAGPLRHHGYNVGVANLFERPVVGDDQGRLVIATTGERLRLFHFHSFDTSRPHELSTRFTGSTAHLRTESAAVDGLCTEYAEVLGHHERTLPPAPDYRYRTDTRGRRISRQTRRTFRQQSLEGGAELPSPFVPEEADAYDAWRRGSWRPTVKGLVGDAAKSVRFALPDEVRRLQQRFPRVTGKIRSDYVSDSGMWG